MIPPRSAASALAGVSLFFVVCPGSARALTWLDYNEDFAVSGPPSRTRIQNVAATYIPGPNPQPAGALATSLGATLLPHRVAASGDRAAPRDDDGSVSVVLTGSGPEGSRLNLPVFGRDYSQFYINTNGALSFGAGVYGYSSIPLQDHRGPALIAPFWADAHTGTEGRNGGNLIYYRSAGAAELSTLGPRIAAAAGLDYFAPTVAYVTTWDRVSAYPVTYGTYGDVNLFQVIVASDGLSTYTLFLYPNRAIWWVRGAVSPADSFASVGVTDGLGGTTLEAAGSGTAGIRDLWFQSNTADGAVGNYVFQVNNNTSTLAIAGDHTLSPTQGAAAGTVTLGANAAGHTITSSAATGSLLFNALRFDNPADSATFTDQVVVLANAAGAIVHGKLAFADHTVLVARAPGALAGGTLTFRGEAKLALYAENATTAATTLRFDSSAGGTGGRFDLRGFSATVGGLGSLGSAGLITNSGGSATTLTSRFDAATHTFGGVIQNGAAPLALAKAGTGTLALTGANTFTGGVTLSGGALELGSAQAIGTTGAISFAGGALRFSAANAADYSARFSTAAGQAYRFDTNGQNVTLAAAALASSGGSLTKLGAGTLTLSAPATFSGYTTVSGGTLRAGAANVLSPSSALFLNHGAILDLAGHDQTVGDFDSYNFTTGGFDPSTVLLGGATVTNQNRVTNNWHGALTGTGVVIKQGTATMNWYGANTFTGTLQVEAGTVSAQGAGTLSPGASVQLATGATLALNNHAQTVAGLSGPGAVTLGSARLTVAQAAEGTFSGAISGSGSVVKAGSSTLTLSGGTTYAGGTTVQAGTLRAGHANAFGSGGIELSGGVLNLNGFAIANPIVNRGGSLTGLANYAGTQTIAGAVSFSGTVGGALAIAPAASLDTTGATFNGPVTVQSGGTLSGTGTLGTLTVAAGGTLAPGNSPGLLTIGDGSTLSGTTLIELGGPDRGTGYDAIDVLAPGGGLGSVTVGGTLQVTFWGGWSPAGETSFQLFRASSIGGTFAQLTLPALTPGYAWNTDRLLSSGHLDLVASAIPEPATCAALAGLGLLGFTATRRRLR